MPIEEEPDVLSFPIFKFGTMTGTALQILIPVPILASNVLLIQAKRRDKNTTELKKA